MEYELNFINDEDYIRAGVSHTDVRILKFVFDDRVFKRGVLHTPKPEEDDMDFLTLEDENSILTNAYYKMGELEEVVTVIPQSVSQINPQRGFDFWISLREALIKGKETPDEIKERLKRMSRVGNLINYFNVLRAEHGSLDEYFNRELVERMGLKDVYHPKSLD